MDRARCPDLNICSQKGLIEKFDSTIGAGTVLMPFGGVYQLSPSQAMAAKIPVLKGETNTCSLMAWGYNPYLSASSNPYHGRHVCRYRLLSPRSSQQAAAGTTAG